jgi:hypothetical protein
MNKRYTIRKQTFVVLSQILIMSILIQVLLGWDPKVFCLSLPINALAVGILRRYRAPAAVTPTLNPGSGMYSFIARVVFWVFVAIILFFVAKRFR